MIERCQGQALQGQPDQAPRLSVARPPYIVARDGVGNHDKPVTGTLQLQYTIEAA